MVIEDAVRRIEIAKDINMEMDIMNWKKETEEDREICKRNINRDFLKKQHLRIRKALEELAETGDLYFACRIAGLKLEEMNELRIKANILVVS